MVGRCAWPMATAGSAGEGQIRRQVNSHAQRVKEFFFAAAVRATRPASGYRTGRKTQDNRAFRWAHSARAQ
ncbi:Uncharacterised protein [Mycobacteroides abscessus subsp. abscessus]|nr:Uncharacterised protein [Mycobacteroides abscessus subsp. abscessus]